MFLGRYLIKYIVRFKLLKYYKMYFVLYSVSAIIIILFEYWSSALLILVEICELLYRCGTAALYSVKYTWLPS